MWVRICGLVRQRHDNLWQSFGAPHLLLEGTSLTCHHYSRPSIVLLSQSVLSKVSISVHFLRALYLGWELLHWLWCSSEFPTYCSLFVRQELNSAMGTFFPWKTVTKYSYNKLWFRGNIWWQQINLLTGQNIPTGRHGSNNSWMIKSPRQHRWLSFRYKWLFCQCH